MKRWAILYALVIVMLVVLADSGNLGFLQRLYNFRYGDKVGHFLLFGLLAFLIDLAVIEHRPQVEARRLSVLTSLVLALLIGLEELSQRWISTRTSSLFDLAASYAGLLVFTWLAIQVSSRKRTPPGGEVSPSGGIQTHGS